LFATNLSWQAKQSILHPTVMFYSDCMKMCEDFALNLGDKRTTFCVMTLSHTSFFIEEFFTKNNMTVALHPSYISVFRFKIKLKGRYFDKTSTMHLKKWQEHWKRCIHVEGDYSEGYGGQ
jgi:hypothetical protein